MSRRWYGLTVYEEKGLYGFILKHSAPKNYLLYTLEWGNIILMRISLDAIHKITCFSDSPENSSALLDFFQRDFHIVGDVYISQDDCAMLTRSLKSNFAKQINFLDNVVSEDSKFIPDEEISFVPDEEPEFVPDPTPDYTPDPEYDVD